MECPLSSAPRPLSRNAPLSPCPLLELSVTSEPRPFSPEPRPLSTEPRPLNTEPRPLSKPITAKRRQVHPSKPQHVTGASNQLPSPSASASQLAECPEGAELNTTLALRAELQTLQGEQWDVAAALKEALEKDDGTQAVIKHRATHAVSFPSHARLYSSLVSVHVPEGHVIRDAVQRIPSAAPLKAPPPPSAGPSLLPLNLDSYHRPLPASTEPAFCLKPRPFSTPFTLYQRQQRWAAQP